MATHSSILAWRIPWTEEPLRLQSKRTEQLTLLFVLNFLIYLFNPNFSFFPWGKRVSQFICSDMSDSLRLYGLEHARPPCLSPTPAAFSDSCPLSW